jgi:hypothetical protein
MEFSEKEIRALKSVRAAARNLIDMSRGKGGTSGRQFSIMDIVALSISRPCAF